MIPEPPSERSSPSAAEVVPLGRSRAERVRFWRAGLGPYRGDPHFVTPLLADCLDRWSPGNPLFHHAETQHFVAVRGGRDVGRVAATVDRLQDELHGDRTGLFGWFECERDPATSAALLDAAAQWLRGRGRDRLRGPLSYTSNGISGLLVRDDAPGPPFIDMPYNPPWYAELLEGSGLAKAKDLLALIVDQPGGATDPRFARIVARAQERHGFTVRRMRTDRRGFAADVEIVQRLYNAAWERNWGFTPMTAEEIRHQARSFRPILDPHVALFAEREGEAVGFSLSLPDVNQALLPLRGRLWPWSAVRLALGLRRVRRVRTITLGVLPEWRRTGLDALLVLETVRRGTERGYGVSECSWILEDNQAILGAVRQAGGRDYRTYRVYERPL